MELVVVKTDKVSCFKTIIGPMLLTLTNKTDLSIESAAFLCFHKFLVDGIGSTNYSGDSILILRGWAGKYGNGTNRYGVMCHMGSVGTWWRHIKAVRAQTETWDIPVDQCHASNSGQQVGGLQNSKKPVSGTRKTYISSTVYPTEIWCYIWLTYSLITNYSMYSPSWHVNSPSATQKIPCL